MYKVGMYGGSFNPLHLGHVNAIIKARNNCEKLYVVLSNTNSLNEVDHKERLLWLNDVAKDMENVIVFEIFDNNTDKEFYDWDVGVKVVKDFIAEPIDVIFAGDDYKEKNIWEQQYPESDIIYIPRSEINISSTQIRQNPYKYFEYLPKIVQKYYTKKVCFVGTESCGKTTLVKNLAKYFNTIYVLEAGRDVCESVGSIDNLQRKHYFEILLKQKRQEKEALERANKVMFIDTDSLYTLFFYQMDYRGTKYDECIKTIAESISYMNGYDLYIFLEPDIKFVQDGYRMNGDQQFRNENNDRLKKILTDNGVEYVSVSGNYDERYEKAKQLVHKLFQ